MKKVFAIINIVLIVVLTVACSNDNVKEQKPDIAVTRGTGQTGKAKGSQSSQIPEKETGKEDNQSTENEKALGYLAILGFDEYAKYVVLDTFPVDGSDESSILMDINNIDQDKFDFAIKAMEAKGCYLVSDIMIDEEKKTTAYQYRNADDTLYIEMVYSADADYINIIFIPINLNQEG